MATQAKKVWCPQCHKRHRIPSEVRGKTLRCRRCRFAFYLEDGLTTDPESSVAPPKPTPTPTSLVSVPASSPADDTQETIDDNYDDILDVLSSPDPDPLAPPRAHAKPMAVSTNSPEKEGTEDKETEPVRQPVTTKRLRSHKSTRRFLMLLSFLFACVLCGISWTVGSHLADEPLSDLERKMLYAWGTPARLLPQQLGDGERLLPVNHVKLRGDFIELADRSDPYRDDFPRPESERVAANPVGPKTKGGDVGRKDGGRAPERAKPTPEPKSLARDRKDENNSIFNPPKKNPIGSKSKATVNAEPKQKRKRNGLFLTGEVALDPDDLFSSEVARSPSLSAPIQSLVAMPENRFAFLIQDKDFQRFGIAAWTNNKWSIKPIELDTKLTIKGFAISDDGGRIAIHGKDIMQFWEVAESGKAELVEESAVHTAEITQFVLTNDGKKVISGDRSGKLYVSVFETGRRLDQFEDFRTSIQCIVPKGTTGFVAMDQRGITRGIRAQVAPFTTMVRQACSLSTGGSKLAYVKSNKEVVVADVGSQKGLKTFNTNTNCFWIRFAGDVQYLLTQDRADIAVWDWRRGERLRAFRFRRDNKNTPVAAAVAEDSKTVAIATGEGRNHISIYEMPGDDKE